jgi:pimeloyl-ACP methyl ester carboxylesterase
MHSATNSNFISYKNAAVHFTCQGKGRSLVLLHGFLENGAVFNALAAVLSTQYQVICIDLFGHGKTENLGYIQTMEQQASMVKAVLNHLKLRKVSLIGHSMGGYICLAFAKLYPTNVVGICLLNSTPLPDSASKKTDRTRAIEIVKENASLFIKTAIPNLFAAENHIRFKAAIQNILAQALKTSKQGIIASLEGMKRREDLAYLLSENHFKTLVFIGAKDKAINTKSLYKCLKKLENSQIIELDGGHMGFIENKTEVEHGLLSFLKVCFK